MCVDVLVCWCVDAEREFRSLLWPPDAIFLYICVNFLIKHAVKYLMHKCGLVGNWLPQQSAAVSLPDTPAEYRADRVITLHVTGHCLHVAVCKQAADRVGSHSRINDISSLVI
jgi:hypothetical protein